MATKPQNIRLLNALRRSPLTTLQIRERLAIGHPAGRVQELRAAGHPITTEPVTLVNRYKQKVIVARYRLRKGQRRAS